jgi:hypothetical protein
VACTLSKCFIVTAPGLVADKRHRYLFPPFICIVPSNYLHHWAGFAEFRSASRRPPGHCRIGLSRSAYLVSSFFVLTAAVARPATSFRIHVPTAPGFDGTSRSTPCSSPALVLAPASPYFFHLVLEVTVPWISLMTHFLLPCPVQMRHPGELTASMDTRWRKQVYHADESDCIR